MSLGFLRFDFSAILFIFYFTIASYSPVDFSSPYRQCCNYRDQQAVVLTIGLTPKQTWKLTFRGEEPLHLLWEAHLEMSKWFAQLPKFICCTPREEFEPSESIMGGVFLQTGQVLPTHIENTSPLCPKLCLPSPNCPFDKASSKHFPYPGSCCPLATSCPLRRTTFPLWPQPTFCASPSSWPRWKTEFRRKTPTDIKYTEGCKLS